MPKIKNLIFIHIAFLIYSIASFLSKCAGTSNNFLFFLFFYGCSFLCLGIYAILWQKILNKNSLIFSYLNKGITLFWGLLFGFFFFQEKVKWNMIVGIVIVILGIVLVSSEEETS